MPLFALPMGIWKCAKLGRRLPEEFKKLNGLAHVKTWPTGQIRRQMACQSIVWADAAPDAALCPRCIRCRLEWGQLLGWVIRGGGGVGG